jgi:hypothetical protein
MLETREALATSQGLLLPSFISENIRALAQYIGVIEIILAEKEAELLVAEAKRYKEYMDAGKRTSTAKDLAKFDFVEEHAEINKLSRYISSGWKEVTSGQSRINHLIAESNNQI